MSPVRDLFRQTFRQHPAGIAILTAEGPEGPVALTISSLISVSAAPPLVAFSLSSASRSAAAFLAAGTLVIHFPQHKGQELARLCATPGADRFGPGIDWERLPTGEPRFSAINTWFRARLRDRLDLEAATLVTAELLEGAGARPARDEPRATTFPLRQEAALVYHDRAWHAVGAPPSPPAAATGGGD